MKWEEPKSFVREYKRCGIVYLIGVYSHRNYYYRAGVRSERIKESQAIKEIEAAYEKRD